MTDDARTASFWDDDGLITLKDGCECGFRAGIQIQWCREHYTPPPHLARRLKKHKIITAQQILRKHNLQRPPGLVKGKVVLDIGCGIRPINWYKPERHICVEPWKEYADVLRTCGYEVWQTNAVDCLDTNRGDALLRPDMEGVDVEVIFLLDVIEHMEKEDGQRMVDLALQVATRQIVLYTPYGFMEQTTDNWGLSGHSLQTHRSGWLPEEFPGWQIHRIPHRHPRGFLAIWNV